MNISATHINKKVSKEYDYIFCGSGASASLLLLQLHKNRLLKNKTVLLIDREEKQKNDKTFCFWSQESDEIYQDLQDIISNSWNRVDVENKKIHLSPLSYHRIKSIDLYKKIEKLAKENSWDWHIGNINEISPDGENTLISGNNFMFSAKKVFDSRTPNYINDTNPHLLQSFVGWEIETQNLDSACFTLMDFDISQDNGTQFVYILPLSKTQALVEITRFANDTIDTERAEELLKQYIEKNYGSYKKIDVETGCIPMTQQKNDSTQITNVINIGARNYNIKPSTGYAFKNMYYQAQIISRSLGEEEQDTQNMSLQNTSLFHKRFRFYDALLLDILESKAHLGKKIFTSLLQKNSVQKTMKFLDERTSLLEEIQIFYTLPWKPFLRALGKKVLSSPYFQPIFLTILTLFIIGLGLYTHFQSEVGYFLLFLGLLIIGIPHGAVDHLLESKTWDYKKAPRFIFYYLLLGAAIGVLWFVFPPLALIIFLLYSMWHFGQADGKIWGFNTSSSFLWGFSVLMYILGTHREDTNMILGVMGNLYFPIDIPAWSLIPWFIYGALSKKYTFIVSLIWLTLSSQIPLLFAFGIYFIGQHSFTGWSHIKKHLDISNSKIWLHSLPFHAGAWLLLILFYIFWPSPDTDLYQKWAVFFIFLACISFPHVIHMHLLYRKNNL